MQEVINNYFLYYFLDYVNKLARMFQDIKVSEDLNAQFRSQTTRHDAINIKILNAGAWAARGERVSVSLPLGEL